MTHEPIEGYAHIGYGYVKCERGEIFWKARGLRLFQRCEVLREHVHSLEAEINKLYDVIHELQARLWRLT